MRDKRLKILSKSEITELYGTPRFTKNERKNYFSLNKKEFNIMNSRGSVASKVHFILQLGYFKATSQFINAHFDEVKSDVNYIRQEYFDNRKLSVCEISKRTRLSNQALIAKLLGFQTDKSVIKTKLAKMLIIKTRLCGNPIYLFHEILCYSAQHKMLLLGYSTMQELIGNAIASEEKALSDLLKKYLSHNDWKFIGNIIRKDNDEYILSALKKDPKSFRQKEIKTEIKKLTDHEDLYKIAKNILPKLSITNQNIQYYANLGLNGQSVMIFSLV